jgi:hypothetical protein
MKPGLQRNQNLISIDDGQTANHAGHLPSLDCAI